MYSKQQNQEKQAEQTISEIQSAEKKLKKQNAERVSTLDNCPPEIKNDALSDAEKTTLENLKQKPNYYNATDNSFNLNYMTEQDVTTLKTIADKMQKACAQQ